jgi:hypothetical protein
VTSSIDWRVVASATAAGLLVLVPLAAVSALALPTTPGAGWTWAFLAVAVAAFATSGAVAGGRRRDVPIVHGILAGLSTFVVAEAIGIVVLMVRGEGVALIAVFLGGVLAATCGLGGALGADWLIRRSHRRSTEYRGHPG